MPDNASNALARLIALTLMADGRLADREISALGRIDLEQAVGISRDTVLQAVADLSGELLDESTGARVQVLDPAHIDALLDAVTDPAQRLRAARTMLVLSKADGRISPSEQSLVRRALAHWHLTLDEVA